MPEAFPEPGWHPEFFAGINDAGFANDDVNGTGLNTVVHPTIWDSMAAPSPTVLSALELLGQTVDGWVAREDREAYVPRERRYVRCEGRRGRRRSGT